MNKNNEKSLIQQKNGVYDGKWNIYNWDEFHHKEGHNYLKNQYAKHFVYYIYQYICKIKIIGLCFKKI